MDFIIDMRGITKIFPGVIANDSIDLSIKKQEIHCILGENGTGKTTLMNVLFGLYKAEKGEIFIRGDRVNINNSKDALRLGLGMIHQHFMLVERMTVLENIILGHERGKVFLDLKESYEFINKLSQQYGFNLDLNMTVRDLSVGMRQRVEILKTLYRGADIIILDEPTAVLTPPEVEELFVILRELKSKGKTMIFITHKLNETMEISDRITVLRKGKKVVTVDKSETNPKELARYMVGRDIDFELSKPQIKLGKEVLNLSNVKLIEKSTKNVNLTVCQGEILGIAGVEGNGQLELEEIIIGTRKISEGEILFQGESITKMSTKNRKSLGIGYIPSDRNRMGTLGNFTIYENFMLGYHRTKMYAQNGILKTKLIKKHSQDIIRKFDIRTSGIEKKIIHLSGGNQQKVILGREVSHNPKFILAAQPTRGLDVGAIEYVHTEIIKLRNEGKAILLISAELEEIMKLSDKVAVLFEGRIMGYRDVNDFNKEELGLLMAGKKEAE